MLGVSWLVVACLAPSIEGTAQRPTDGAEERQALLVLNTAGRLYRQKNWQEAAAGYGEFLQRFPRHADAADARFARGYCLYRLDRLAEAAEEFRIASRKPDAAWLGEAHFYLGRSLEALAQAEPEGSAERTQRFIAAATSFGRAAELPLPRDSEGAGADERGDGPVDFEALARAAQGECLYAGAAYGQVVESLASLVSDSERLASSKHYPRGLYVLALAHYSLAQSEGVGGAQEQKTREVLGLLTRTAPSSDPLWFEAGYLRARLLHESGERQQAIQQYEKVAERGGLHAAESSFHASLARYELAGEATDGDATLRLLSEAGDGFGEFLARHPEHELALRARFHQGLCQFERGLYAESKKNLQAVADTDDELSELAWLRLGQAFLLQENPDAAAAAAACAEAARRFEEPARGLADETSRKEQLAEAIYWRGEALLSPGPGLPPNALDLAADSFSNVAQNHSETAPELSEKALYQEARARFLAGRRREAAQTATNYRNRYPSGVGRYYAESLQLSAENALRATPQELGAAERRNAARYYAEAAKLLGNATEARTLKYLSGFALYSTGDYKGASVTLSEVLEAHRSEPLSGFDEPDLPFFLADSLAHSSGGASGFQGPPSEAERVRLEQAVALFREYLAGAGAKEYASTASLNLGLCQKRLEDWAGAANTFETFLKDFPEHSSVAQVRFELANVYLTVEDLPSAAAAYRQAGEEGLTATPPAEEDFVAQAFLQSAKLERVLGNPEAALTALERLRQTRDYVATENIAAADQETRPLYVEAHFQRATAASEAGNKSEAKTELRAHVERLEASPFEPQARIQLAQLLLDDGENEQALGVLEPLVESTSAAEHDHSLYLTAWANGALARGAEEAAEQEARNEAMETAYRRLIAEHPGSRLTPDAMVELGQHLFNRRSYAESKEYFAKVLSLLDAGAGGLSRTQGRGVDLAARSLLGLGFIAFEQKAFAEARGHFDAVVASGHAELMPRALFQGARSWMLSAGETQAVERFQRFLDEYPGHEHTEEALLRLGESLHQLQRYADATAVLDRMVRDFPDGDLRHEGLFARGFARQFLDRFPEAIADFRRVVAETQAPVAARAQYHIGECFVDQGEHRPAAREFLTVVANFDFEGDGPGADVYQNWVRRGLLAAGLAYETAGDTAGAKAQYRDLVRRFADSDEGKAASERLAGL